MIKALASAMSDQMRRLRHALQTVRWLMLNPVQRNRGAVAGIVVLQGVSTACQVASFLIVIRFINLVIDDWSFGMLGSVYQLEAYKVQVFWLVCLATLALLVCGALMDLLARKRTAALARQSEEQVLADVLRRYHACLAGGRVSGQTDASLAAVRNYLTRSGRYIGRGMMALTSSLVPMAMTVICVGLLLYLNPFLTAFVLSCLLFALPLYVRIAVAGQKVSQDLLHFARHATLEKYAALDRLRFASKLPPAVSDDIVQDMVGGEAGDCFMDAYQRRLTVTATSTFLTQILIVIMLTAIFLSAIYPAVFGDGDYKAILSYLLLYLVAFKFFGSGLVATMNTYITMNVFYSYFRDMIAFLGPTERESEVIGAPSSPPTERASGASPVAAYVDGDPDRACVNAACDALRPVLGQTAATARGEVLFLNLHASSESVLFSCTPRPAMLHAAERIRSWLHGRAQPIKGLEEEIEGFPELLGGAVAPAGLSAGFRLLLAAVLLRPGVGSSLVAIDGAALRGVPHEVQDLLWECLSDDQVVVLFSRQSDLDRVRENGFSIVHCVWGGELLWSDTMERARHRKLPEAPGKQPAADAVSMLDSL